MATGRQVRRLFDLEIDEVSLVDKPANQFGKVAFSKRAEDEMPRLFDLDGNEVAEDELEHGETVTNEAGEEFVYFEEGTPEYAELAADVDDSFDGEFEDYADDGYDDEDEEALAGVGKASTGPAGRGRGYYRNLARAGVREGRQRARGADVRGGARRQAFRADVRARSGIGRHPYGAVGGAAAAGAAGGAVSGRTKKNFGASVYEELSKALTQSDRDEAISKAMDVIDDLSERYQELEGYVQKMADDRALEDFSSLAREYGPLPVHPARLGQIMKRASDTLPAADVEILDRLFSSVGEQLYSEFGKGGTGDSLGVYDQVVALSDEVVGKSDLSREQAITAIFAENPQAYEEYLAETGQAGR